MPTTVQVETECLTNLLQGTEAIDAIQCLAKKGSCPRKNREFRLTILENPRSQNGQLEIKQKLRRFLGACEVCGITETNPKLLSRDISYTVIPLDDTIDIIED